MMKYNGKCNVALAAMVVVAGLSGCGGPGDNPRARAEDLIEQAKKNCTQLGYAPGTREHVDCTSAQFNLAQQRVYGPLH